MPPTITSCDEAIISLIAARLVTIANLRVLTPDVADPAAIADAPDLARVRLLEPAVSERRGSGTLDTAIATFTLEITVEIPEGYTRSVGGYALTKVMSVIAASLIGRTMSGSNPTVYVHVRSVDRAMRPAAEREQAARTGVLTVGGVVQTVGIKVQSLDDLG